MQLSKSTHHWHTLLGLFPQEVHSTLLSMIRPLSRLFSPVNADYTPSQGEPDGIDGISQQGHYQQLLLSEWAMLDLHPDEFARRAAMQEHLFIQPAQVQPDQKKISVVLFDNGPDQLGQPRVVQLALLILLWRRAMLADAQFQVGFLQNSAWMDFPTLDVTSVNAFLNKRSFTPITDAQILTWQQQLSVLDQPLDDVWVVTNRLTKLTHLTVKYGTVSLAEKMLSSPPTIQCTVQQPNKTTRQLLLPMPPASQCTQIIRNPFTSVHPAHVELTNTEIAQYGFSNNGRRLVIVDKNHNLAIHTLPNKSGAQVKKPMYIGCQDSLQAVSVTRRNVMRAVQPEKALQFLDFPAHNNGRTGFTKGSEQHLSFDLDNKLNSFVFVRHAIDKVTLFIRDDKQQLRKINLEDNNYRLYTVDSHVVKIGMINSISYYIKLDEKNLVLNTYLDQPSPIKKTYPLGDNKRPTLFIHASGVWNSNNTGCLAYQLSDYDWAIVMGHQETTITVEAADQVVGVYIQSPTQFSRSKPVLVILAANRQDFYEVSDENRQLIHSSSEPVYDSQLNPAREQLIYRSQAGYLEVYSFEHQSILTRIQG